MPMCDIPVVSRVVPSALMFLNCAQELFEKAVIGIAQNYARQRQSRLTQPMVWFHCPEGILYIAYFVSIYLSPIQSSVMGQEDFSPCVEISVFFHSLLKDNKWPVRTTYLYFRGLNPEDLNVIPTDIYCVQNIFFRCYLTLPCHKRSTQYLKKENKNLLAKLMWKPVLMYSALAQVGNLRKK